MLMEKMELADFGTFLGTRELGKKIKTEIQTKLGFGASVIIDFGKVEGITNSFADECFGKLLVDIGPITFSENVKFSNLDPTEKSIINFALHNRAGK